MTKTLILTLALLTGAAHSGTVATAGNKGGGIMVLTDVMCSGEKDLRVAYSTLDNNKTMMGCWTMDDNFIFIRWNDGDVRTYPFDIWDVKTKKKGSSL